MNDKDLEASWVGKTPKSIMVIERPWHLIVTIAANIFMKDKDITTSTEQLFAKTA